jgi:phosphorylase kinase alpha/beta subunit
MPLSAGATRENLWLQTISVAPMTLSSAPTAGQTEPMQLSAAEAWQRLQELDAQIDRVVLQRQHPITGLLPASTANTVHGNYGDAWVRDCVYSIQCVWGLALAHRRLSGYCS